MATEKDPVTLGDALPREMARVRDEVMPAYMEIGAAGAMALMLMRRSLDQAAQALAQGNVVAMLAAYTDLTGYNT